MKREITGKALKEIFDEQRQQRIKEEASRRHAEKKRAEEAAEESAEYLANEFLKEGDELLEKAAREGKEKLVVASACSDLCASRLLNKLKSYCHKRNLKIRIDLRKIQHADDMPVETSLYVEIYGWSN